MDEITHKGRIVAVEEGTLYVEIISSGACSSCAAAGLCVTGESARRRVEVKAWNAAERRVGEEVEVCLGKSLGLKAVLLSYVVPVVVLLVLTLSLSAAGIPELWNGVISVAGVALYYAVLALFRERIGEEYAFYLK